MDHKLTRLRRRYTGLSRVTTAINDLYIYGIYPGNFPNLVEELEKAKDLCKNVIAETKEEIEKLEGKEMEHDVEYSDPLVNNRGV